MGKSRLNTGVFRDGEMALEHLQSSLIELQQGIIGMERGNNLACRTVAVLLKRILDDELPKATRGREIKMRSYITLDRSHRPVFPLTTLEVSKSGTRIAPLVPSCQDFDVVPLKKWKEQIVFHGEEASVFFEHKTNTFSPEDLSRHLFLKFTRDETGAHFDKEISHFSLLASKNYTMLDLHVVDEETGTAHEQVSMPHKWNYLSATIATIGFEFIKSIAVIRHDGNLLFVNHPEKLPATNEAT